MNVFIRGKDYTIARATKDDLPQIVAIYNQGIGVANADFEPVTVASREAWFLAHDTTRPLIVAKDGRQVVAWASLSNLYERPAYVHSTEISVYVDRAYHGYGLGACLVNELLQKAKAIGITNVVALIFGHNVASLAMFQHKFGFCEWGLLPKVCLSQGQMADVVILGKSLI